MGFGGHPLAAIFLKRGQELFTELVQAFLLLFHLFLQVAGRCFGAIDDLPCLFLHGLMRVLVARDERIFVINDEARNDDQSQNQ